jgi:Putative zinc- or iron-chelating domain
MPVQVEERVSSVASINDVSVVVFEGVVDGHNGIGSDQHRRCLAEISRNTKLEATRFLHFWGAPAARRPPRTRGVLGLEARPRLGFADRRATDYGQGAVARRIQFQYRDPVECVWVAALARLGIRLVRSSDVYASWDGESVLTLARREDFDPDDSLAQMIFHELCHLLVASERDRKKIDFGLDNTDDRDLIYEHACHRLQAALSAPFGLREFMAVTTEWRPYWDALPADPLAEADDPAVAIARLAHARAQQEPYQSVLSQALSATALIADAVRDLSSTDSLWKETRARHVSGFLSARAGAETCGGCAWAYAQSPAKTLRCRQTKSSASAGVEVGKETSACERWEPKLAENECGSCGACCHRGFDLVQISATDPFRKLHRELLVSEGRRSWLPRPDGNCVALTGNGSSQEPYRCTLYPERPRSCRLFEVAGDACLVARQRTGLSKR